MASAVQIVGLSSGVAVHNVCLITLKFPGLDYKKVSLADPHPLAYLTRDAPHPGDAILTHYFDARRPQKLIGNPEYLSLFVIGERAPGDLFIYIRFISSQFKPP